jgi:hypothetical protein
VSQVVEYVPSIGETLGSIPSTDKNKTNKQKPNQNETKAVTKPNVGLDDFCYPFSSDTPQRQGRRFSLCSVH